MSVRSVVACRSSARITTIKSPSTVTPMTTEQQHEEDSEKSYHSMLNDHTSTIAYLLSIVNR